MTCMDIKNGVSSTNRPVQLQKMARNLKFPIKGEEELYYPCSENKGADQLGSYCEADLHVCFRKGKRPLSDFSVLNFYLLHNNKILGLRGF